MRPKTHLSLVLMLAFLAHCAEIVRGEESQPAPTPTPSTSPSPDAGKWWVPQVEAAAAGGFVGINQVQLQRIPLVLCPSPSPGQTTPIVCSPDPTNNVLVVKNQTNDWRPAVSAGLVFRWRFPHTKREQGDDSFGIGVGGHFVFVPQSDGTTSKPAPALTAHFGKSAFLAIGASFLARPRAEGASPTRGRLEHMGRPDAYVWNAAVRWLGVGANGRRNAAKRA